MQLNISFHGQHSISLLLIEDITWPLSTALTSRVQKYNISLVRKIPKAFDFNVYFLGAIYHVAIAMMIFSRVEIMFSRQRPKRTCYFFGGYVINTVIYFPTQPFPAIGLLVFQ